jgi:hypothetical protein
MHLNLGTGVATMQASSCLGCSVRVCATLLIIAVGTLGCNARYLRGKITEVRRGMHRPTHGHGLVNTGMVACGAQSDASLTCWSTFFITLLQCMVHQAAHACMQVTPNETTSSTGWQGINMSTVPSEDEARQFLK